MYLQGKVQTAKVDDFFGGIELRVVDKAVERRTIYTCKLVRGWPGLDVLKEMRKRNASVQELTDFVLANIQLPQEDQVLDLIVVDVTGKSQFKTLVCELAAQAV
jgi:hypothetical protein